jgi:SAM-dependent methyltransferase
MERAPGFYGSYASHKGYATPTLGPKEVRRFDAEIWGPATFSPGHSVLEIGCGTGLFLAYLKAKGVSRLLGIDLDAAVASVLPDQVRPHFTSGDARALLEDPATGTFDRVVMLDVLEHFTFDQGRDLLAVIRARLNPGGKLVIKVPNMGSPWGMPYQFGDLTHLAAFAPISIRQLANDAGFGPPLIYDQRQGTRRRRITDALVHRFLSWALLTPPEFWGANLYAVLPLK